MTSEACDETPLDGIERGSLFCGLLPGRCLAEINSKIPSKPSASASSGQRCRSLRFAGLVTNGLRRIYWALDRGRWLGELGYKQPVT